MTRNATVPRRPVLFGEALFDRFPDGAAVPGGAPLNVALHLRGFGLDPLLVSAVGEDALGKQLLGLAAARGLDSAGISIDRRHATGVVDVVLVDGEPTFTIRPDAAWDYTPGDGISVDDAGLLYHGSLALRRPAAHGVLARLHDRLGAPRFLDVNLRKPWWSRHAVRALIAGARWVKLNGSELAALGVTADEAAAARELLGLGQAEWLVVTRGAAGAVAYPRGGDAIEVRPSGGATPVVDTVGAGDAFSAVLIAGLLGDWPLATTLERAQAFASRIVGCRGALPDDPTIYREALADWKSA